MDFDFRQEYARYSNVELLRVILLQHQYQPAAVAIAEELLATRNVTEEDHALAAGSVLPKRQAAARPVVHTAWQVGDEIFDASAALPPFEAVKQRWLILTVILCLVALYKSWGSLNYLIHPSPLPYAVLDILLNILLLAAQVGGFILFFQKKRWGWILTLGWVAYMATTTLLSVATLAYYGFYRHTSGQFIQEAMIVTAGILLCSHRIKSYYSIDRPTQLKTLLASGGGSILLCIITAVVVYALNR